MVIDILTIFPEMFESVLNTSILGRARSNGLITIETMDIRPYSASKHKNTDDYPYGGGAGMLMMAQPIADAMKALCKKRNIECLGEESGNVSVKESKENQNEEEKQTGFQQKNDEESGLILESNPKMHPKRVKRIYMSPRGQTLTQKLAQELAQEDELILLCGHYEGVDQRVLDKYIDMEISVGDYVLTGGEMAAMVLVDCVARLIPGVLGSEESPQDESFSDAGLLEYPQYTRPRIFEGMEVPEVLLNGDHAKIAAWRRRESIKVTMERRPEMLKNANLTEKERKEFGL